MNLADAELQQARGLAQQAMLDKEQYVRVCALLSRFVETKDDSLVVLVEGKVAVRAEAFKEVPRKYTFSLRPAKVKPASDDPNEREEDVIVCDVQDAKPRPLVIVPKNGVA